MPANTRVSGTYKDIAAISVKVAGTWKEVIEGSVKVSGEWKQFFQSGIEPPAFLTSAPIWLDASDLSTITESSGSVSQWDNKGTSDNFVQPTGSLQPTTGTQTLNGLNVLDFDGDFFNGQTSANWKFLHDGTKYFVAVVVKFGNVDNPGVLYGLFGNNAGGSAQVGFSQFLDDRTGIGPSNRFTIFVTKGTAGVSVVSASTDEQLTPNQFQIVSSILDPGNATTLDRSEKFIDGGSGIKDNVSSSSPSTANPTNMMQIGTIGNGAFPIVGQIAEFIVVSGADATTTNRQEVEDYLNAKWSVF